MQPLRLGVLGGGVVGGGVVEILRNSPRVQFVRMCVRDASKKRDFELPAGCELTTDSARLLEDDIDCLVEVAGGTTVAYELMLQALAKGKHVVTANKAAISANIDALSQAAEQAQRNFLFEAAVCGGIPIINTVRSGLAADQILGMQGIMNGTTNYILSRMFAEGIGYGDCLQDAKDLGYAEADPAADVEGWDARSKLCILAKMAFGLTLDEQALWTQGITHVSKDDFAYAKLMNGTIKLLGVTKLGEPGADGKRAVEAWISPTLVKADSAVGVTSGPTNLVSVDSKHIGTSVYIGAGAGRWPTAQSIVADILRVTAPCAPTYGTRPIEADAFDRDFAASWYLRCTLKDQVGALASLTATLAEVGISVYSVLQTPILSRERVTCAIITDPCKLSQVEAAAGTFAKSVGTSGLLDRIYYLPIVGVPPDV